jgi:aldose 1-epimerase
MEKYLFGQLENEGEVWVYPLTSNTATVEIMTRGATIKSFVVNGIDVVGGFDTLEDYLIDDSHQGATIGRVANRVAKARFVMDGKEYKITANAKNTK